jgi:hypothetical protein
MPVQLRGKMPRGARRDEHGRAPAGSRRQLAPGNLDNEVGHAAHLAGEAGARKVSTRAFEHVELLFARRLELLAALADDDAAGGACKLAAALVLKRNSLVESTVKQALAAREHQSNPIHTR